jgi:hypothetical protein
MRKKEKRVPGIRVPVSNGIFGYLSGSPRSVHDSNPKVHYPRNTHIRPGYKKILEHVSKNMVFLLFVSGTRRSGGHITGIKEVLVVGDHN